MTSSKDELASMHSKLAESYLNYLKAIKGQDLTKIPNYASVLAQINKFLKDNQITSVDDPGTPLNDLKETKLKFPFPISDDELRSEEY